MGFRLRTGNPRKQQDAQYTLGDEFKEFGTLPLGLDEMYFRGNWKTFHFFVGKKSFPFKKSNELFWSDCVSPEGMFLGKGFTTKSPQIDTLDFRLGHFFMISAGQSLSMDTYFQGSQSNISLFDKSISIYPGYFHFKNVPNIPDGNETFILDYSILHLGTSVKILRKTPLEIELDYYRNLRDYDRHQDIPVDFKDQKTGLAIGAKLGAMNQKGDWLFHPRYARIEQYSIIDFMAQNDWARWDYSSDGSPDGRVTNFSGFELVLCYMIADKAVLKLKYFDVEQLIPYDIAKETGSRIRLDLDVQF